MDVAIQKAQERQDHILTDEETIQLYEMRQMAQWDYANTMKYAHDEGMAMGKAEGMKEGIKEGMKEGMEEGIKEGIKRARMELARNALAEGASVEFIQKITGFDMDTIQKLQVRQV